MSVPNPDLVKPLDPNSSGFQAQGFSWDEYIKYRPPYHSTHFSRIYDYHASHSSSWDVAHDTGAGAGIASEHLARKFKHVHVSDPGVGYVEIAEKRFNALGYPERKFTFHAEGAEKSSITSDSLDLLLISEAIHFTDIPIAMAEFARQVKKGGTVAVCCYATPAFIDPIVMKRWHEIMDPYFLQLQELGGVYERAVNSMGCGWSCVGFPTELYEKGAKRIYVNTGGNLDLLCPLPGAKTVDRTLESDERIFVEGDRDWIMNVDAEYLRGVMMSMVIGVKEEELPSMEGAIGGKGVKTELFWPNFLFLATRA